MSSRCSGSGPSLEWCNSMPTDSTRWADMIEIQCQWRLNKLRWRQDELLQEPNARWHRDAYGRRKPWHIWCKSGVEMDQKSSLLSKRHEVLACQLHEQHHEGANRWHRQASMIDKESELISTNSNTNAKQQTFRWCKEHARSCGTDTSTLPGRVHFRYMHARLKATSQIN